MVSIVVVSHSHPLACAAVEFARGMQQDGQVRVAVAAGLDEATLGTDAMRIKAAIEEMDEPGGVLVLMDLGSAVLSAETALELLDPDIRSRVALCPAPLVEGLVVAMVSAAGGSSLSDVADEATAALEGKRSHLAPAQPSPQESELATQESQPPAAGAAPTATGSFVVSNQHGLHARPAARLVAEVRELAARVALRNLTTGAGPVSAASLSRVATLGAREGHQLEVSAQGARAQEAVDQVLALAARGFDDTAPEPAAPEAPGRERAAAAPEPAAESAAAEPATEPNAAAAPRWAAEVASRPLPAGPGIGFGPAWTPKAPRLELPDQPAGDPATEWRRLDNAIAEVRRETMVLRDRTSRELGKAEAAIFDAHLLLLDDTELLDQVRRGIDEGRAAEVTWAAVVGDLETQMAALADAYQRARAGDVRGVGEQVLRALLGASEGFEPRDGVLIAADLTPTDVSRLDPDRVKGIILAQGSPAAHAAILARTLGIPMVVGAGPGVLRVAEGTTVALDGATGELVIDPDQDTLARFRARAADRQRIETEARAMATRPAVTGDGVAVEVAANVGTPADATQARAAGADAAGLVRTEFLFLDRDDAPDVAEQERTYRAIADALGGRRVTLRTLDVGGDKPLPYLPSAREANPFLGLRGIRLSLAGGELLRDQLVAACRVARDTPVSLMFPMVSTLDELRAALEILDEAFAATGGTRPAGLTVGIMVEVPAAALKAEVFVPYLDFFSVGTNDLTQYTLAAERGNGAVARLADPMDPAVLRLIDNVCRAAASRVAVAVCGEAASDETAIPVLLGLGVRELSVVPPAVAMVKRAVREIDTVDAAALARAALNVSGAQEARALVASITHRSG